MSKLKVGDRVRVIKDSDGEVPPGSKGLLIKLDTDSRPYLVALDNFTGGCEQDPSHWWFGPDDLVRLVKRKRPKPAAPDRASLRDHFAGLAMQALLSPNHPWGGNADEVIPRIAYKVADALIAEGVK